ncbi:ABC transporter ATP-binding protein [Vibrio mimicus]
MKKYLNMALLLPKTDRYKFLLLIPLVGFVGLFEVASIASLIPLMQVALDPVEVSKWAQIFGIKKLSYEWALLALMFLVIAIFVTKNAVGLYVYKKTYEFVSYAKSAYQKILFSSYLNKPYRYHVHNNTSDYLRNLTTEINAVEARFIMPVLVLLSELIPILFLFCFLLYLNPFGLVVSALMFFLSGLALAKFNSSRLKMQAKYQIVADGAIVKTTQQVFYSIREVLIYGRRKEINNAFSSHSNNSAKAIATALFYNSLPRFFLEVVAILCVFLIAFFSYSSGNTIQQTLIELGVFLATLIKVLPSASKIVAHIQAISYASPSVENYLDALGFEGNNNKDEFIEEKISNISDITFRNVCYSYNDTRNIFDNLNLTICKGDVVGIIGETGAGKSTLINLLLGLIEPKKGEILVSGKPLRFVKKSYWEHVGYVPQETYLIDGTIKDNIEFYRTSNNEISMNELLSKVSLTSTIDTFEQGIDTNVGESGGKLSGGQRQRIGIARSLFNNPDVLILDEATSALDNQTEEKVIASLSAYKGEKTLIMIAHRESTLSICDYVIWVGKGVVNVIPQNDYLAKRL